MAQQTEAKYEQLSTDAKTVLILHNPKAGASDRAKRVDALQCALEKRQLVVHIITDLAELAPRSTQLLAAGELRAVVAAGGDGTVGVVANETPNDTPIAIFPLGTENLFAKYLGYPTDVDEMSTLIAAGRYRRLDAIRLVTPDSTPQLVLVMAGCGFDAEVIHRLHRERQGHITHLAYAKPIFEALRKYDYPPLEVECFDQLNGPVSRRIVAHWAFAFNAPSYAAGLPICPNANPSDGKIDIVTFRGGSSWRGLIHLANVLLRRQRRSRRVENVQASHVRITSKKRVPIQVDGDPSGVLPIELTIVPNRLTLLAPTDERIE